MSVRLLLVDDHHVVRMGFEAILKKSPVEIVGTAADGTEALEQYAKLKPDVVLLDVRLPDMDGIETLEKLREVDGDCRAVMISSYDNPTYVARSLAHGAVDFVAKGCPREELIDAIERAAQGDSPGPDSVVGQVRESMGKGRTKAEDEIPITNRELQVLRHVALGLSNREIARSLDISIETVKEHVQNTLRKLKVTDRTQAAVWAVREGIV